MIDPLQHLNIFAVSVCLQLLIGLYGISVISKYLLSLYIFNLTIYYTFTVVYLIKCTKSLNFNLLKQLIHFFEKNDIKEKL
jgi:hypothetical protein